MLALTLAVLGLALLPAAAGDTCIPSCDVESLGDRTLGFLFVPPVTVVESGSSVTWRPTDGFGHTATANGFCFHTAFGPVEPASALFLIAGGQLFASTEGDDPQACGAAISLPDGSFALDYRCLLHSNMNGRLLVR